MVVGGMKDGGKEFALETEYFDFEAGEWRLGKLLPKGKTDHITNLAVHPRD